MVLSVLSPLSCSRTGHREHVYFISDVKSGWTKQEAISMLFVVKYQARLIQTYKPKLREN